MTCHTCHLFCIAIDSDACVDMKRHDGLAQFIWDIYGYSTCNESAQQTNKHTHTHISFQSITSFNRCSNQCSSMVELFSIIIRFTDVGKSNNEKTKFINTFFSLQSGLKFLHYKLWIVFFLLLNIRIGKVEEELERRKHTRLAIHIWSWYFKRQRVLWMFLSLFLFRFSGCQPLSPTKSTHMFIIPWST